MQFMPKTCPHSSLTGTSGLPPRRNGVEQIVHWKSSSLPSSQATGRWVLARNSLSSTLARALRCSFSAAEFGAGGGVGTRAGGWMGWVWRSGCLGPVVGGVWLMVDFVF